MINRYSRHPQTPTFAVQEGGGLIIFRYICGQMDTKTFTDNLSRRLNVDRQETQALTEALGKVLAARGAELDSMAIPGFGSFEPRMRKERVNVHPATGKRMLLPPKVVLTFRPSALLKDKVKAAAESSTNAD